jgi:hypothetical protein
VDARQAQQHRGKRWLFVSKRNKFAGLGCEFFNAVLDWPVTLTGN